MFVVSGKNCSGKGHLNEAIQCDLCAMWVHASCEGVSSDDYKLLTNLTSATDNVIYYCNLNQCLSRVKQIVFQHFNNKLDKPDHSHLTVEGLSKHFDDLSLKIVDLSAKPLTLQPSIQNISSSFMDFATQMELNSHVPVFSSGNA